MPSLYNSSARVPRVHDGLFFRQDPATKYKIPMEVWKKLVPEVDKVTRHTTTTIAQARGANSLERHVLVENKGRIGSPTKPSTGSEHM